MLFVALVSLATRAFRPRICVTIQALRDIHTAALDCLKYEAINAALCKFYWSQIYSKTKAKYSAI